MAHFQRHPNYGRLALHDAELEARLNYLHNTFKREPTFIEIVLEVGKEFKENPSVNVLTNLQIDYDVMPQSPRSFLYDIIVLAKTCFNSAAVCLDTSSITTSAYRPATGGVKETLRPYRGAFFMDRFTTRVQEFQEREQTPFAVLQAFATGPDQISFDDFTCRYEIFLDVQETDGRMQSESYPEETVPRGILLCLALADDLLMNKQQQDLKTKWLNKVGSFLGRTKARDLYTKYEKFVATMSVDERVGALMCTLASRNFIVERPQLALACYYWDSESLVVIREELKHYSEDANGPKLYGCYWRMCVSWLLVVGGLTLSLLSGILNWASRDNRFERVNDAFQTFLLILAVPGFTVKIAATNGEQAVKDWLVGTRRIKDMEQLERIIH